MPDSTLSEAIKEAYASRPTVVIHHTLELNHAAFTTPIRVKRGAGDILAVLEATAPRDAGMQVTFLGFGFDIKPPEGSGGHCMVELDNVSREIVENIELSMTDATPITMIYRAYLETDLTKPQNNPPLELSLISISATPFKVTATAVLMNFHNKKFPGVVYDDLRFPSLVQ
jgi:hypothetical protein